MTVSLLTVFLGGALALLSPCAALLMPAFFASTVSTGKQMLRHAFIFFLGLILILAPLGLGAGLVGTVFGAHRQVVILLASLILIALGGLQILGFGFDAGRLLPGTDLHTKAAQASGYVKTFLLGMASGVGGFCAGPILGAVLTVAATQDNLWASVGLMMVYGAGMVLPLVLIALGWQKLGDRGRTALRGRTFNLFGRTFHSTSVVTGILMIGVGILFWTTNGLASAPEIVPVEMQAWLQNSALTIEGKTADVALVVLITAIILLIWGATRSATKSRSRK